MTDNNALSTPVVETIAGFTAGVISTLCLHPLDLIKTRLQVDQSSSPRIGSSLRLIREISRYEGGISALYRGLTPNILGNSTSWGFYFLCYGNIKDSMRKNRGSEHNDLRASEYFVASGVAGLLTAIFTNPIWVIKTRMLSTGSLTPGAYPSLLFGVRQIFRSEGVAGFYHGLLPSLFGVSHGAFQFMAYERLKLSWPRLTSRSRNISSISRDIHRRELTNVDLIIISTLSKMFAGCITYPYQVLRSRLQTYDAAIVYRGVIDVIVQVWRKEGVNGFYKGLGPSIIRVLPSTWVTFLVYENVKMHLSERSIGPKER
ncbi:hypothetical protein Egran_06208 [Elaphomyces granulatus]|uniref:Uncharacterized protein n=1 Tax=Elaphomyces granulatus TaxID=519963 RepID=A0A232LPK8_9EURO|nr:hypothetical protein Egran_06208 [Elaphomyces granulatus]